MVIIFYVLVDIWPKLVGGRVGGGLSSPGLQGFLGCTFQSRMVLDKLVPVGHCGGRPCLAEIEITR